MLCLYSEFLLLYVHFKLISENYFKKKFSLILHLINFYYGVAKNDTRSKYTDLQADICVQYMPSRIFYCNLFHGKAIYAISLAKL